MYRVVQGICFVFWDLISPDFAYNGLIPVFCMRKLCGAVIGCLWCVELWPPVWCGVAPVPAPRATHMVVWSAWRTLSLRQCDSATINNSLAVRLASGLWGQGPLHSVRPFSAWLDWPAWLLGNQPFDVASFSSETKGASDARQLHLLQLGTPRPLEEWRREFLGSGIHVAGFSSSEAQHPESGLVGSPRPCIMGQIHNRRRRHGGHWLDLQPRGLFLRLRCAYSVDIGLHQRAPPGTNLLRMQTFTWWSTTMAVIQCHRGQAGRQAGRPQVWRLAALVLGPGLSNVG